MSRVYEPLKYPRISITSELIQKLPLTVIVQYMSIPQFLVRFETPMTSRAHFYKSQQLSLDFACNKRSVLSNFTLAKESDGSREDNIFPTKL
jgi:hypothetical protein